MWVERRRRRQREWRRWVQVRTASARLPSSSCRRGESRGRNGRRTGTALLPPRRSKGKAVKRRGCLGRPVSLAGRRQRGMTMWCERLVLSVVSLLLAGSCAGQWAVVKGYRVVMKADIVRGRHTRYRRHASPAAGGDVPVALSLPLVRPLLYYPCYGKPRTRVLWKPRCFCFFFRLPCRLSMIDVAVRPVLSRLPRPACVRLEYVVIVFGRESGAGLYCRAVRRAGKRKMYERASLWWWW
ncbi:hypothetical protein MTO96_024116 [Rhipicephalus appendiculatus]